MSTPVTGGTGPHAPEEAGGAAPVLAVDVGGTKTTAAVVLPGAHVLARAGAATPAQDGPQAVLATVVHLARAVSEAAAGQGAAAPVAVGIGTAGVVDPQGRTVVAATSALAGWAGTPVADHVEDALGVPAAVLGDVQAFLAGESAAGAARGARSAVAVMAGTGIGGAVAVNGRVLRGAGGAAGHLGHIPVPGAERLPCPCGRQGHVEAVASGPAMTEAARRRLPGRRIDDLRSVARLAHDGVPEAIAILESGGTAAGVALAGVVAALDPDVVVLGGGVLSAGPWYGGALRAAVAAHTLPLLRGVAVRHCVLGADAVLLGAAAEADALACASAVGGRCPGQPVSSGRERPAVATP